MKLVLYTIILAFVSFLTVQCTNESYTDIGGIYIEDIDLEKRVPNCYNEDNHIYTVGKEFIFEYEFFDNSGVRKFIFGYGDKLYDQDKNCSKCIKYLGIEPLDETEMSNEMLTATNGYNQTLFQAEYIFSNGEHYPTPFRTGVIENAKNVWLHPWRKSGYFSLLQSSPYPFIMAPFAIGNKWKWELKIGGSKYLNLIDDDIESILSVQNYEIVNKEKIETKLGALDCWVIEATGKNGIRDTKLRSYFHEDFGFVLFEYNNIDGSRINISISEIRSNLK